MPNNLINETSPYLLQHANNPVDWYPWRPQALSLASREDKPILLSIGYAACHWCHVMEHESFENEAIAALMNEHFVCIKVDREERPDLDKIYQAAHQMLTQRPGGWPLTVAITPVGHAPFFAGTYFPPEARQGMPGFAELLVKISTHYRQHSGEMSGHEASFKRALAQLNPDPGASTTIDTNAAMDSAIEALQSQFDPVNGGFGSAPKFPHPTQLELLFRIAASDRPQHEISIVMANKTLRKMYQGGLFDQLAGGFYRYSVDREWRIPHFEKMLYDNAQLMSLYADGHCLTDSPFYRRAIASTAHWVMAEMQQPHGGFAATLDADSEGVEGKYYVWSETDLRAILNAAEYEIVEKFFALYGEPNFEGSWHFNVNEEEEESLRDKTELRDALSKLYIHREERVRPGLDDKILAAWNGMMIKGMARASLRLDMPELAVAAQKAVDFVHTHLWRDGRMLASWREQQADLNGYLDDYAFVAEGLLELLQVQWRSKDLIWLTEICDVIIEQFEDNENGGFFFTSHDHESLLYRPKSGPDDAIPSSNGAAASVLYRVGMLLGKPRYIEAAQNTVALFAADISRSPSVYASLFTAAMEISPASKTVIIRGSRDHVSEWARELGRHYLPGCWVYPVPDEAALPEAIDNKKALVGKTVGYICQGFECGAPVDSLQALEALLINPASA